MITWYTDVLIRKRKLQWFNVTSWSNDHRKMRSRCAISKAWPGTERRWPHRTQLPEASPGAALSRTTTSRISNTADHHECSSRSSRSFVAAASAANTVNPFARQGARSPFIHVILCGSADLAGPPSHTPPRSLDACPDFGWLNPRISRITAIIAYFTLLSFFFFLSISFFSCYRRHISSLSLVPRFQLMFATSRFTWLQKIIITILLLF